METERKRERERETETHTSLQFAFSVTPHSIHSSTARCTVFCVRVASTSLCPSARKR